MSKLVNAPATRRINVRLDGWAIEQLHCWQAFVQAGKLAEYVIWPSRGLKEINST